MNGLPKRPNAANLQRRMMGDMDASFHTHAYAHAASARMGSTAPGSFASRRKLEYNRRSVGSYRTAMVYTRAPHTANQPSIDTGAARPASTPTPRQAFHEPPTRGYNPFG